MNRRNFFKGASAIAMGGLMAELPFPEARRVEFSPPGEPPTIHWTDEHISIERFVWLWGLGGDTVPPEQIRHGWASRKLSGISLHISDAPLPNFEPITYWIPTDFVTSKGAA